MDFSHIASNTIDASPYYPAERLVLALDEEELQFASDSRFERFFRVWYTERTNYAPALKELTILLRPNYVNSVRQMEGIRRFVNYFHRITPIQEHFVMYLDCPTGPIIIR